nr:ABC transporter permease [Mediterraneibacter glycyrrhizinilyticus]
MEGQKIMPAGEKPARGKNGFRRYFVSDRRAAAGWILLGVWILLAVLVPLLSPYSYSEQNASIQNSLPSLSHWFGTDKFGRDLFARVWYGAGLSLLVGLVSAGLNGCIGVLYGAVSGYAGKTADMILMRIADVVSAIPSMLYVILITLVMGAGAGSIILGLCIAGWIDMARIVRGEILRLKGMDFARAAQMEGISPLRILVRHLLPNAVGPITVNFIFLIPQAIFTEAFLSFLGIGIAAPAASLGTIIQEARSQMMLYPYQMVFPLLVLCVMMAALNMIGTSLEQRNRRRTEV